MATKIERVPVEGFEFYYNSAVEQKAKLREELEAEMEAKYAERTVKLDKIIAETSEEVEVEVPDEEVEAETETVEGE